MTERAMRTVLVAASLLVAMSVAQKPQCTGNKRPAQTAATLWAGESCPEVETNSTDVMTHCCRVHQACYRTCGAPQATCDRDFGVCLGKVCQDYALSRHREPCNQKKKALKAARIDVATHKAEQRARCECAHPSRIGHSFQRQAEPIIRRMPLKFMSVDDKLDEFRENLIKEAWFDGNEWRHLYDVLRSHPALIPTEPTLADRDGEQVATDDKEL